MRGFIFKIFILYNLIQFFDCTNFEYGQSSSTMNNETKVRILDEWMEKEEFEFLHQFDPKERFKMEIYKENEPMNMIEGEYKKIDKKYYIIFKNLPWNLEKEKQELKLKIGIGSEDFGFGQIIKRNFNEEISIISETKEKLDENIDGRNSKPKSKNEIKAKLERLNKAEKICSHHNLECEWQQYYINNSKIIYLKKLILLNNKTIVNEGNSMHSAEQVELTKKLTNLIDNSRKNYLPLQKKQWELNSKEGWPIGPEPYIPDNLLHLMFPTMSGVHIPSQTVAATNSPSPSNALPLMSPPMNTQIPIVPITAGGPEIQSSSSTEGRARRKSISLKELLSQSEPAVQPTEPAIQPAEAGHGQQSKTPKVGGKKDGGEKQSKKIIIGGTVEGEMPRKRGPGRPPKKQWEVNEKQLLKEMIIGTTEGEAPKKRKRGRPPKNPVKINHRKKIGVLRPKVVEKIGESSRNPIVSGAQNIPQILGSSLIRNNVPMMEVERSNPPPPTRNEGNVNLNSVGQNFIHAEEEEDTESD